MISKHASDKLNMCELYCNLCQASVFIPIRVIYLFICVWIICNAIFILNVQYSVTYTRPQFKK